jgi:hypothetical protein
VQIDDAADISDYVVEIEILNQCNHVNIIQLLESYYYGGQISVRSTTSECAFFGTLIFFFFDEWPRVSPCFILAPIILQ